MKEKFVRQKDATYYTQVNIIRSVDVHSEGEN